MEMSIVGILARAHETSRCGIEELGNHALTQPRIRLIRSIRVPKKGRIDFQAKLWMERFFTPSRDRLRALADDLSAIFEQAEC